MSDTATATMSSPSEGKRSGRFPGGGERRKISPGSVDRLPPHSIEAEQGVLGCLLLLPDENVAECITKFRGTVEAFYDVRHQAVYQAVIDMNEARHTIDLLTLHQWLKDRQQLEAVGGSAYLASLPDKVPSAANLRYYADIVWEKFLLRRMIAECTQITGELYECEGEVEKTLDEVETRILRLNEARVEQKNNSIRELVSESITQIEQIASDPNKMNGLATGFTDLDRMTTGLKPGEMIVIAARPSMGKTSLAMNIAEDVAVNQKLPVGVFSLEMTAASLTMRLLCCRAKVSMHHIRTGLLSHQDFPKLTSAAGALAGSPIFIDDTSGLSILQLRAKARRMHQRHGVKLFVIDYLQLLHSTAARAKDNRQQEIADISNGIKGLAKELSVPVIVLSQLNREMEREKGRKPRLSDLRESGSIEQDADLVGLLYKPSDAGEEEAGEGGQPSEGVSVCLYVAKQRNGPTGDVPLTFLRNYTCFVNAAKIAPDDQP